MFSCCAAPDIPYAGSMAGAVASKRGEVTADGAQDSSVDANSNDPAAPNLNSMLGFQRRSWGEAATVVGVNDLPEPHDMKTLQDNLASIINSGTRDLRESITSLKRQLGGFNNQW